MEEHIDTGTDLSADLTKLASDAGKVAVVYADATHAFATEATTRGVLVRRIIAAVMPALPALCSRPKIASRTFWPDNVSTATEDERAPWKGLYLGDEGPGPSCDYPRANRGAFDGTDYFLRSDSVIVKLTYTGHWSKWQGESDAWESSLVEVADDAFCKDDDALASFTRRIAEALRACLNGKLGTRAEAARKRAERLTALASLL